MQIVKEPSFLRPILRDARIAGKNIGLVPTMGALHEGHISLISTALKETDIVVVSIFVNPTQFNSQEDLNNYPRQLDNDIDLLDKLGIDILFTPSVEVMYPEKPLVNLSFGPLDKSLEGKFRPGHFNGVGLVVMKLFGFIHPDKAYFGLKDLQQYLIIKRLTEEFEMRIEIIGVPTTRDKNGLALSSRNQRLSKEGKKTACNLYKGLKIAGQQILKLEEPHIVLNELKQFYAAINFLQIEYCEFVNGDDFSEVSNYDQINNIAICVAGFVEGVRLIDNIYLQLEN